MRFGRGEAGEFFSKSQEHAAIMAERQAILAGHPERHAAMLPGGELLLAEAWELAISARTATGSGARGLIDLGLVWEPDFLLLRREASGTRLVGGCVCFPSSWALREKMGLPMQAIHDVVPGLNATLGSAIDAFLERLKPGRVFTRSNWGLSRSAALNQHPELRLPRLDGRVNSGEVFFRVEEQGLAALPKANGILFGIRVKVFPLDAFAGTSAARQLAAKLRTMPEEMARYKGLAEARGRIAALLDAMA
jgi:hypothetical protein